MDKQIYNCHIHTFTSANIPDRFLPLGLNRVMKYRMVRRGLIYTIDLLKGVLRFLGLVFPNPITKGVSLLFELADKAWLSKGSFTHDALMRYDNFFETGGSSSQQQVFDKIRAQYPDDTRFVVLPMDMSYMGSGKPLIRYEDQLNELSLLHANHPNTIIPFFAADPRRENLMELFNEYVGKRGFRGVKLYPNLGYFPNDAKLREIYRICEQKQIPVLAHCSPGGIRKKGTSLDQAKTFAHPGNYEAVLKEFPKLNFCLAHFGGSEEWERQITGKAPRDGADASWLSVILRLLTEKENGKPKYPNLFTDVSYTMFMKSPSDRAFTYFDYLKVLMADPAVADQVLFGTDYYMVEQEKYTEKEVSIALRSQLGEEMFFKIANENPKVFLYEKSRVNTAKAAAKPPVARSRKAGK
ncbi:MAG TPA: amidohydrolase family protein [Anaerolineales bacterium]|nr:amidohydrolase family protein [Anaerolineales bacterium]HNN13944.1 amidohydrolase family protein [Anaerolineales bacterium]HNO31440.1 amidohydrolase family protein [Anaerolineales bacterium]